MPTTAQKIALITGANKGIGFEIARQIAKAGYTVLLGSRDADRGQQAAATLQSEGLDVRLILLDLSSEQSIAAAAVTITNDFGHLDILVNNAGIADRADGLPSVATIDVLKRTFDTNFFAAVAITQATLPLLRKAPAARIVNVSSGLGSITQNADPNWMYAPVKVLGYNSSKAALNMFTVHLAYELRDTPIKVNCVDPGYTATDLNNNQGHQTVPEGAAEAIRLSLLGPDGPTGTFSNSEGIVPW